MLPSFRPRRLIVGAGAVHWLLICVYISTCADAQIPSVQQIHFVPKTYFLQQHQSATPTSLSEPVAAESSFIDQAESSFIGQTASTHSVDITRNPRHLAPDRYYVDPSVGDDEDQSTAATTSLRTSTLDRTGNPIKYNVDLDQELKLDIINRNQNQNNNHYEAKILSNPHSQSLIPRKSSRGKNRRIKSRPPKNAIIYSYPEQSFYAPPSNSEEATYSEPDSREATGLRSDLGDQAPQQQQQQQQQEQQQQQQQPDVADSKEFKTTNSNLLSQKKALLGQCMAQCLDAIL